MGGYFNEFYNDHLMGDFTKAFGKFQSISDDKEAEILLRSFIIGEFGETMQRRNYNFLKQTCKNLIKVGCYSSIIRFMYGIFQCGTAYNLEKLKEVLDKVEIPKDQSLAELCGNFYILMHKMDPLYEEEYDEEELDSIDLYAGEAGNYFDFYTYPAEEITKEMPVYLAKRILNIDIDIKNISKQDIDNIVNAVIRINSADIEREEDYIRGINKNQEDSEKKLNDRKLTRIPSKKITEYDKKVGVLGLLLDIFKAAELTNQDDICYYIQTQYLWPIMKLVPWKQRNSIEVQFMGILLGNYLDTIFSLELSQPNIYHCSNTNYTYNENDFFEEFISDKPGKLLEFGMKLTKDYNQLGILMSEVISVGKDIIKQSIPAYLYSFIMAITPYLLYCSGKTDEANVFLIRNYDEISFDDKRKLFVQLTMVKCIMACNKLEWANILYGYYNYEMDRQEREQKSNMAFAEEIVQYIKDVKDYIKASNEYTIKSRRAWVDVVFGDGIIMKDVNLAESHLAKGEIVPEALFRKLMLYVDGLSYYSGIRLGVLGLPKEDNYDKLPNALSNDLIKQGQGIVAKLDEYLTFYQSVKYIGLRQNINIFLQRHISKLMDETVQDSINKIKALRETFILSEMFAEAIESKESSDEIADEKSEEMLKRFEEITNELAAKLECQYIGRAEVELSIDQLQKSFMEKYNLKVARGNLVGVLPLKEQNDCSNYLVTSEIVYRMLSNRRDAAELDFSPALIPLTKAMELVLNLVFKRMPFVATDIDEESRKHYFEKNEKRESIEFGPCINLLKDSPAIYVNLNSSGVYKLRWGNNWHHFEGKSRFSALQGNIAIAFDKLKVFKGLSIYIQYKSREGSICRISTAFTDDEEQNRLLFIKGLEYVKDNYRNIVAHKDGISLQTVKDCREILLQTEDLLWILLYIINN